MAAIIEPIFEHLQGGDEHLAVFLHGILGSGANLRTIARRFLAERPGWSAWLVDLRGHGASDKGTPGPSLAAAARDVRDLCAHAKAPPGLLVGHSFGGKVALEMLRSGMGEHLSASDRTLVPLGHVMTLDSPPGPREPVRGGDSALAVIEMLRGLPRAFPSKTAFVEAVMARGHGKTLAQWLAMSTEAHEGAVRFALDLDEIEALVLDYFAQDLWPIVESPPAPTKVHLVIGDRSSSWSPAERERARALAARTDRVTVDVLPTDHWVHAEDPDGLLRVMLDRVPA